MFTAIVRSSPRSIQALCWRRAASSTHRGQWVDQLAAVGLGHELSGHQEPVHGVLPAHQRLDSDGPQLRLQLDLRLEVQHELAAWDAVAQLAQQRQPALGVILRRRR